MGKEREGEKERFEDATLLILQMEEGALSQECRPAVQAGNGIEWVLLLL